MPTFSPAEAIRRLARSYLVLLLLAEPALAAQSIASQNVSLPTSATPAPGEAGAAITVEQSLRQENVSHSVITPDGSTFVFELLPGLNAAANIGSAIGDNFRPATARLMMVDLNGDLTPRPLFEQDPAGGYWLGALSPHGSRLAVYSLVDGRVRLGVFEFSTARIQWFGFTPNWTLWQQKPVWLNEEELTVTALEVGQPWITDRAGQAALASERWSRAFAGREPSAQVMRSSPNGAPGEPPDTHVLLRVDATTGAHSFLGRGDFSAFRLSPDRRYLAALRDSGGPFQVAPEADLPTSAPFLYDLVILDLQNERPGTGIRTACGDCYFDTLGQPNNPEWSPDGESLFFAGRRTTPGPRGSYRFNLHSGTVDDVAGEGAPVSYASLYGFGNRVPLAVGAAGLFGVDNPASRAGQAAGGANGSRVVRISASSGTAATLVELTEEATFLGARSPGSFWNINAEDRYSGASLARGAVGIHTTGELIRLNPDTGEIVRFPAPIAGAYPIAVAARAPVAVYRQHQGAALSVIAVREGQVPRFLFRLNPDLQNATPVQQRNLEYEVEGQQLSSCIFLPPGWTPGRRYPAIFFVYPGWHSRCQPVDLVRGDTGTQLLAAHGYIVVEVSTAPWGPRGRPDGSQPSQGDSQLELGPRVVAAAANAAVAAGYADADRLGILGVSQGNYSVLLTLTEVDCFRAAMARIGWSNRSSNYGSISLSSRLGATSQRLAPFGQALREELIHGSAPWEDPDAYVRSSPTFFADRITTPLLLMNADFDSFSINHSDQMFAALFRLRRDAEYVTYWGEGHGNLSPANIRDQWQRTFNWFDRHFAQPRPEGAERTCTARPVVWPPVSRANPAEALSGQ